MKNSIKSGFSLFSFFSFHPRDPLQRSGPSTECPQFHVLETPLLVSSFTSKYAVDESNRAPSRGTAYIVSYHDHFILQLTLGAGGRVMHGRSTVNLKLLLIALQLVNLYHNPELIVSLVLMQIAVQL